MENPLDRFCQLLERAQRIQEGDARAVCLATADGEGFPSARMVVLSGVEREGFVFYSNYESRKARDLHQNLRAALCFHWPALAVQVRVEGVVEKVSREESDAYFANRPRGHQLAAYASRQSTPLESHRELQERFREADTRFAGRPIPRPASWGGYRLHPERIEFWHGFENRLHSAALQARPRRLVLRAGQSMSSPGPDGPIVELPVLYLDGLCRPGSWAAPHREEMKGLEGHGR